MYQQQFLSPGGAIELLEPPTFNSLQHALDDTFEYHDEFDIEIDEIVMDNDSVEFHSDDGLIIITEI